MTNEDNRIPVALTPDFVDGFYKGLAVHANDMTVGDLLDTYAWMETDETSLWKPPTAEDVIAAIEELPWTFVQDVEGRPKREWRVEHEGY